MTNELKIIEKWREGTDAIKKLKNNKAAGKYGIGVELIKMGTVMLATCQQ